MRNILLILALLFSVQSFSQDDDFFWSYSHPVAKDTIKFYRQNDVSADARLIANVHTHSGGAIEFIRVHPTLGIFGRDTIWSTRTDAVSDVAIINVLSEMDLNQYYTGWIITNHNDLKGLAIGNVKILDMSQARLLTELRTDSDCEILLGENISSNKILNKLNLEGARALAGTPITLDITQNTLLKYFKASSPSGYLATLDSLILPSSPGLYEITASPQIRYIEFGDLNPSIHYLLAGNIISSQDEIDKILKYFVDSNRNPNALGTTGNDGIYLCYSGNSVPSATGLEYVSTLLSRGWIVCVNTPPSNPPSVSTLPSTLISQTTATLNGSVSSEGSSSLLYRGLCWATTVNPTVGSSHVDVGALVGTYSADVTGLTEGTLYHVRAYAANSVGISYGEDITFTTLPPTQTVPELITTAVTGVTSTTATSGGHITSDGAYSIYQKGVCWDTSPNPNTLSSKTEEGTGTADFISSVTGLTAGTTYYLRAYATNRRFNGSFYVYATGYGQEEVFTTTTIGTLPTVAYVGNTGLTSSSVTFYGNVVDDGGLDVTTRGICWSTSINPTILDSKTTDGSGVGNFSSYMSGLNPATLYYTRLYATNSAGTAYTSNFAITTQCNAPSVLMGGVSGVGNTYATASGDVTTDGGCIITERGFVLSSTNTNPTIGGSGVVKVIDTGTTGPFSEFLSGLTGGTTYYVNSYAINSTGTSYGTTASFTTTFGCPAIGSSLNGGIVAYLFVPGDAGYVSGECHGIITTSTDYTTDPWWGSSYIDTGATSEAIGSGTANTSTIVTAQGTFENYAARTCYELSSGGYTDWVLPSKNELSRVLFGLWSSGSTFSSDLYYWTSSELDSTYASAIKYISAGSYFIIAGIDKSEVKIVRPIRYF